ncbi:MAG: hypothetical protein ABGW91_11675 [Christiangramia sp.]|nr:hypothetical protein [Christiangramia sp.]
MKRVIFPIFIVMLFAACDDGEIVVDNLDFEDSTVDFCDGPGNSKDVIYAYKNDGSFESFSVEINNGILETNENGQIIPPEEETLQVNLNTEGLATYRIYNTEVPSDYFCSVVPPSNIQITQEWISGDGAKMFIQKYATDIAANADADGDGLTNLEENFQEEQDTDEDGIPDYLDVDDDNDNVYTSRELEGSDTDPVVVINGKEFLDTDEDGIPDYLDEDDDNDGIPTRNEVNAGETRPENLQSTEEKADYRNAEQTGNNNPNETYRDHDINRDYSYVITITGLELTRTNQSDAESLKFGVPFNMGSFSETNVPQTLCPYDTCPEEEPTETTGSQN